MRVLTYCVDSEDNASVQVDIAFQDDGLVMGIVTRSVPDLFDEDYQPVKVVIPFYQQWDVRDLKLTDFRLAARMLLAMYPYALDDDPTLVSKSLDIVAELNDSNLVKETHF